LWTVGAAAVSFAAGARADGAWFQLVAQARFQDEPRQAGIASHAVAALRSDSARWVLDGIADTSVWSSARLLAHEHAPPLRADEAVALLEIPAIELRAVVVAGTGAVALNRAIGHVEGTAAPGMHGHVALAAHRDGFFRRLGELHPGDRVLLDAGYGPRAYAVQGAAVVAPDATHVLDPAHGDALTLVTCHPFYYVGSAPERYVVRALPVR
jgi:sortase A